MRRKIGLGVLIVLINLGFGVISFREYLNIKDRISNVELNQKALVDITQRMYDIELKKWEADHKKTVTKLLKILGVDGKYDLNNILVSKESLKTFFNHRVYAKISLRLEAPEKIREINPNAPLNVKKSGESTAIVVGRYVLMASHTNDPEHFNKEVMRIPMFQGFIEVRVELKVLEHAVTILLPNGKVSALKEIYRNREKDFSLFEISKTAAVKELNFPFKIGDSSQLKIGEFIYMNGRPGGANPEVARAGYVTALSSTAQNGDELKKDNNEFGISQSTEQGDSGSSVIAFRDGKPELVGFYLGWIGENGKNTRSRALKIDVAVDEIKKNLGIDLRELQWQILSSR